MKLQRHFLILLFSGLLLLPGCEKESTHLFEVRLDANFEISSSLPVSNVIRHYVVLRDVPVFYAQNLAHYGVDESQIKAAYPSYGSIQTRFGEEDLSFIEDVIVRVLTPDGNKIEIYRLDFVKYNTHGEIRMLSQTFDGLKEVLKTESIDLEIGFRLRRFPPRNISARIDFGYAVYD
ncbi:MAG: hypothetical protein J5I52_12495 [Saprospiraceae bacterium]|nr:MAG: hypothetical protein UZ09_BCD002000482 [Bacteroidetes bacterium OLB9]MCO6464956.1 hypothetical protein [Saprospiraceae bacterium]MCZ2340080.1 hypothetical protein [Chitinophagales bacterium]